MFIRIAALALTVCLSVACLSGCKKDSEKTNATKENITLRYWTELNAHTSTIVSNMADTEFYKQLSKDTGVTIKYEHPTQGQAVQNFNLMLASGDLPDIIQYNWGLYPGGAEKAIKEGYIIDHKDVIENYSPDFKKYIEANHEIKKQVITTSGKYIGYPNIREDKYLVVSAGPYVRKDWLDELGLGMPETIDDWTTMLTVFRDKKGASAPLSFSVGAFARGFLIGAYGGINGYYMDEAVVKYGPIEPGFKEFLTTLNKWYDDKLLDNNIATLVPQTIDFNILHNNTGASEGSVGQTIGRLMASAPDNKFQLVPVKYPVLKKGMRPQFGHYEQLVSRYSSAISATSTKKEAAAKFLNYGYTAKGRELFNFGIENVSYTKENGYPKYTDLIMKSPEGLSPTVAMKKYIYNDGSPTIIDKRYMEQYAALQVQKDAINTWMDTDAEKHMLPTLTIPSEVSSEFARVQNAVDTYRDEMMLKFILGAEPLTKFDDYVKKMKELGVEKNVSIYQQALNSYNKQ